VPVSPTYPGVYVNELPNPVMPIVGVPTSVTAFVGPATMGITDDPVQCNSWSDYESTFGSLDPNVPLSYAVYMFFLNGGSTALVVRNSVAGATTAQAVLSKDITLDARSEGTWANTVATPPGGLTAVVDTNNLMNPAVNQFNLTIKLAGITVEQYPGLSVNSGTANYIGSALLSSQYVGLDRGSTPATVPVANTYDFTPPAAQAAPAAPAAPAPPAAPGDPAPAAPAAPAPFSPLGDAQKKTGMYALVKANIFNILCLPVDPDATYDPSSILDPAREFCEQYRAMLIIDPPTAWEKLPLPLDFNTAVNTNPALSDNSANAVVYYPNLTVTTAAGTTQNIGPSGAIAGLWSQTDVNRGVWKAPAGTAAVLSGVTNLTAHIDDGESGVLNPIAINALRTFPEIGPVIWGARTSVGADQTPNQWKYIPVRRTALFIEESLRRGTQWAVFEPNDEPLWSSLRLNVTTFMQTLFSQGAFQGSTPQDAYLVKCDGDNNPQSQIDLGIVNILVGFAPLKPAEFVIINIQQQAGQS
jgi:phage tail sheath protein FI